MEMKTLEVELAAARAEIKKLKLELAEADEHCDALSADRDRLRKLYNDAADSLAEVVREQSIAEEERIAAEQEGRWRLQHGRESVSEMGTQEWMERELTTIRAAVDSLLSEHDLQDWSVDEIAAYVQGLQPATRILVQAAFGGEDPRLLVARIRTRAILQAGPRGCD